MSRMSKVAVVVLAAVLVFAGVSAVIAAVTTKTAGPVTAVSVKRSDGNATISTNGFSLVNGAKLTVNVPRGTKALLVIRFAATTQCDGSGNCELRIRVGKKAAQPGTAIFDSSGGAQDDPEAHMIERSIPVGSGKHAVRVQGAAVDGGTFRFRTWHLTVERAFVD